MPLATVRGPRRRARPARRAARRVPAARPAPAPRGDGRPGRGRDRAHAHRRRARRAQAKLEAVIESIEDGLVVLDPHGVVVHVNEVACAILGFERDEALGRPLRASSARATRTTCACARPSPTSSPTPSASTRRVEIALFLRGRDHFYVLRPTPLRARDGTPAGPDPRRSRTSPTCATRRRAASSSWRRCRTSCARRSPRSAWPSSCCARRAAARPEARAARRRAREDVGRLEDVAQRLLDALALARDEHRARARRRRRWRDWSRACARIFALQARERGVTLETALAAGRPRRSPATRPSSPGRSRT